MNQIVSSLQAEYLRYKGLAEGAIAQLRDADLVVPGPGNGTHRRALLAPGGQLPLPLHRLPHLRRREAMAPSGGGVQPAVPSPRTSCSAYWEGGWAVLLDALGRLDRRRPGPRGDHSEGSPSGWRRRCIARWRTRAITWGRSSTRPAASRRAIGGGSASRRASRTSTTPGRRWRRRARTPRPCAGPDASQPPTCRSASTSAAPRSKASPSPRTRASPSGAACRTPRDYGGTLDAIAAAGRASSRPRPARTGTVGIGIPGVVSRATGLVKNANSTWLNGRPLRRDLEARLGRPVRLANDANCFALSEAIDGAGRGCETVFGVILGTGVGGGHRDRAAHPRRAQPDRRRVGPQPAALDDRRGARARRRRATAARRGCIETWLSGPGFERDAARSRAGAVRSSQEIVQRRRGRRRLRGPGARALRGPARPRRSPASINLLDPT